MKLPVSARYSWEQTVSMLRRDPAAREMIFQAYLTEDLNENCRRFAGGAEFAETLRVLRDHAPESRTLLDMPGGNGVATVALASAGYIVTAVEPDPSESVGRGAINATLQQRKLDAAVVNAYGEDLPFTDSSFDIAYVRQGLHHARELRTMLAELARVLRPGGLLLAVREHVVDNYGRSLRAFLSSQIDHELYGGENAFTLSDYRAAFSAANLLKIEEWGPYDSTINMYPFDEVSLREKILASRPGRLLSAIFPAEWNCRLGLWWLKRSKAPGRLYSFLYRKPSC